MKIRLTIAILSGIMIPTSLMGQAGNPAGPATSQVSPCSPSGKVYIASLSFLDMGPHRVWPLGEGELIDRAVDEILDAMAVQNPRYVVHDKEHSPPNNDANAHLSNYTLWDEKLSRTEKVDRIIDKVMMPYGTDGLVTGYFAASRSGPVEVRFHVLSRASRNAVSESRTFAENEFLCRRGSAWKLCDGSLGAIRETMARLFRGLDCL